MELVVGTVPNGQNVCLVGAQAHAEMAVTVGKLRGNEDNIHGNPHFSLESLKAEASLPV
jgi:hypothetical protein